MAVLTNQSRIKVSIKQEISRKESVKSAETYYFLTSYRASNIRYITNRILVIYLFISKKAYLPKPLFITDIHLIPLPTSVCFSVQLHFTSNSSLLVQPFSAPFLTLNHRTSVAQSNPWKNLKTYLAWKKPKFSSDLLLSYDCSIAQYLLTKILATMALIQFYGNGQRHWDRKYLKNPSGNKKDTHSF